MHLSDISAPYLIKFKMTSAASGSSKKFFVIFTFVSIIVYLSNDIIFSVFFVCLSLLFTGSGEQAEGRGR